MFETYRCGQSAEVQDVTKFTLKTFPTDLSTETGKDSSFIAGTRASASSKRNRVLNLDTMESIKDILSEFSSSMVFAMIFRSSGDDDVDRRYKKFQRLELVLRMKGGLPSTEDRRVLQCLKDDAARLICT